MLKIGIVNDVHAPYHHVKAVNLVSKVLKQWKPDIMVFPGDIFDFYAVSAHDRDPSRAGRLKDELKMAAEVWHKFAGIGQIKQFIEGNHEFRLDRYIARKAPELHGMVSVDSAIGITKSGWEYTRYRKFVKIGKIVYTHDLGYEGAYAAKRSVDKAGHSIVFGHVHRIDLHVESDIYGTPAIGATFGWLGDITQVDYAHSLQIVRDWALGFGVGYMDEKTGVTQLVPVPVVNNSCILEGEKFDA